MDTPPLSRDQVSRLVDLTGDFHRDADAAAAAGLWRPALILLGSALEASIVATACCSEPELRAAGLWPPPDGRPIINWTLGKLLNLAVQAGWLPRSLATDSDLLTLLDGDVGDAVRFVLQLRNAATHPANYVHFESAHGVDFQDQAAMEVTCRVAGGIVAIAFDHLRAKVERLPDLSR